MALMASIPLGYQKRCGGMSGFVHPRAPILSDRRGASP